MVLTAEGLLHQHSEAARRFNENQMREEMMRAMADPVLMQEHYQMEDAQMRLRREKNLEAQKRSREKKRMLRMTERAAQGPPHKEVISDELRKWKQTEKQRRYRQRKKEERARIILNEKQRQIETIMDLLLPAATRQESYKFMKI